ncbi:MAG TPA: histidine kinase [Gemmatimonadaceae bacterium]|jgi:signal transduction histidine kinase|nr:histidine kinase [Gemmatimonadaceae bacterium]
MIATAREAAPTVQGRVWMAVREERTRIARELHDGLLQDAMAIALHLRAVLPDVRAVSESAARALVPIVELAEKTTEDARRDIMGMRDRATDESLVRAVERTVRRATADAPLTVSIAVMGHVRPVRDDIHDAVVRIVREAGANIARHACARTVRLTVVFATRRLRVVIDDDGSGFDPHVRFGDAEDHFGVIGMRERAHNVHGRLDIRSTIGMGTTVTLDVPLSNE